MSKAKVKQQEPPTTVRRTEEVSVPEWVVDSFKKSAESWLNTYGEELVSKVAEKYTKQMAPLFEELNSTLKSIDEKLSEALPLSKITVIKEVSYEDAKQMVESYLRDHKKADTEELLLKLGLDLETLVKILDELKKENKIEAVD